MRTVTTLALPLALGVMACGERSPTGPSHIDVTGTWNGLVRVSRCETNGDGRDCQSGTTSDFAVVLRQDGASVSGTLFVGAPTPVAGSLRGNTLLLSGSRGDFASVEWRTIVTRVGLGWAMHGELEEQLRGGILPTGAMFMMRRLFAVQIAIQQSSS